MFNRMLIKTRAPRALRENLILLILLPLIAAACILLWYMGTQHFGSRVDYREISSESGVYDLSGTDFENTVLRLGGNAELIPDTLLTPEEFNARAGEIRIGRMEGYGSVSTTRVRVVLPDDGILMLAWSSSDYSETVYINGELRGQVGHPGLSRDDSAPGHAFWYFSVQPVGGAVEIVRQVSNFVHRNGGGHASIVVGSEENIRLFMSLRTDFDAIAVGLFIALFFVHLTLYFILRSYRANLYFAALCFAWALRTGVVGMKIFLGALPFLTWETAFRIEYLSIPIGMIFVILIVKEIFPAVMQKWPVRAIIGVAAAFGLMYLFADTLFMSYSVFLCYAYYIAAIAWLAVRLCMKLPGLYKKRELLPEHFASLFGLAVFLYAAVHDAFYYNDIYLFGLNTPLADISLTIFSFSHTIAMTRGTMREFALAQERERQLTLEKKELEINLQNERSKPLKRTITYGSLMLDTLTAQAFVDGADMKLTPKEFSVLRYLLMNESKYLSAEQIYEEVWNAPLIGSNQAIKTAVSRLRGKLDSSGFTIAVSRGEGYCFEMTDE